MKTIIAGGRDYQLKARDFDLLTHIDITEVVSGGAKGADSGGELYAQSVGLPCKRFRANWNVYGKAAGPIRNKEMAQYADAAILFPGGRGTASMCLEAAKAGLKIYDFR